MTILEVNKFYSRAGGAEVHLLALEKYLKAARHRVVPFSMADGRNIGTEWARFFAPPVDFRGGRGWRNTLAMGRMFWSRPAAQSMQVLLNDLKRKRRWPEVAHAHNIYHQLTPSVLAVLKKNNIPVVMTVHDMHFFGTDYGETKIEDALCNFELKLHKRLGLFEKLVDYMIAPSRFAYKKLVRWGFPPERVIYLRHAVEALPKPKSDVKHESFLNLVFVGRLAHEKGVHHLLSALAQGPKKVTATIVGEGPLRPALERQAERLGLGERVKFVGEQFGADLSRYILAGQALAVPSSVPEVFGLMMVEAMSLGRPVLAFDHGAAPEIVEHGKTGWLVEPTTEGLIKGLEQVIKNYRKLTGMNKAAHAAAKAYGYDEYLPKILAVYEKAKARHLL